MVLSESVFIPFFPQISIKFDPFMNLSVPLPKEQRLITVYVVFKDPSEVPLKVCEDLRTHWICFYLYTHPLTDPCLHSTCTHAPSPSLLPAFPPLPSSMPPFVSLFPPSFPISLTHFCHPSPPPYLTHPLNPSSNPLLHQGPSPTQPINRSTDEKKMKSSRFWRLRTRKLAANSQVLVAIWYVLRR